MGQVRTETPVTVRTANGVAIQTSGRFEDSFSGEYLLILIRGPLLRLDPGGKVSGAVHPNAQEHLRVLRPAILGTLAKKQAGVVRVKPHFIDPVRDQVRLAGKLGNPEAVIGVSGEKLQESGRRM